MTDNRNIVDIYKYWTEEAIKADLRTKHHNFSALVVNQINDFNLGSVIRNSNAVCAKEVIVYGKKSFDRRSTVGTHLYMDMKHVKFVEELDLTNKVVVGIDNIEGAVPMETFEWPKEHVVMAFGQETTGLCEEVLKLCKHVVYIQQYGSVRSLNVGCASAIAMFSYCLQNNKTR